jgi:hypothetical protein
MFLRAVSLAVLVLLLLSGSARADDYADISWVNLVRTLVRFNALDLSDQNLLDEYAIVSECDLYKAYFNNDFKWNQVRQAIRDSVAMNVATFPSNYHYDISMRLDRYDFAAKLFRFTEKSSLRGVNAFTLYSVTGTGCGQADVKLLPRIFRAVLSSPVYLDGLPLSEGDAEALLSRMDKNKNPDRTIYARYNFHTVYIEPLHKVEGFMETKELPHYEQAKGANPKEMRLDTQLDSVGFYEDPQMTKLIYLYTP